MSCVEIGPVHPTGMLPIERCAIFRDMAVHRSEENEDLGYLEEDLNRLTVGILDVTTDDLPRRYQRHTVGVSGWFSRLLHRVAQDIICYHEHHCEDD